MRKILPVLLALIGLGLGIGAGLFLRPPPADEAAAHPPPAEDVAEPEYIKLANQFVVPVLDEGRVAAMVVMSLSLELAPGNAETAFAREPKIRDAFLQVLFDHANSGGFRGSFTDGANLVLLRAELKETAVLILGDVVSDVLITEIARQDS